MSYWKGFASWEKGYNKKLIVFSPKFSKYNYKEKYNAPKGNNCGNQAD